MSDIWDDLGPSGEYVKFETEGDTVTGTITTIGIHEWADGKKSPQIGLDTEDGAKVLTAGQVQLAAKLRELRPNIGDTLTVKFERSERRDGGKTLKHFTVTVSKGNGDTKPPF